MSMPNWLNFVMNQNSDLVHKLNRKVFPKDFCRTGNLFLCLRSSVHVFHSGSSFVLAVVLQNHFWSIRCQKHTNIQSQLFVYCVWMCTEAELQSEVRQWAELRPHWRLSLTDNTVWGRDRLWPCGGGTARTLLCSSPFTLFFFFFYFPIPSQTAAV